METPIYIGAFNVNEIKNAIKTQNRTGKLLSEVAVSSYFGKKKINLMQLDALDQNTFKMAVAIISYRRNTHWDDREFFELAKFSASQHNIKI